MEGDKENNQYGISQRTIHKLFSMLQDRVEQHERNALLQDEEEGEPSRFEYSIEVGMLEIYNDEGKHWRFSSLRSAGTQH